MTDRITIPHVTWRNGRPRFSPSDTLRKAGHTGHDLKNADGSWMSEGQALDWSNTFQQKLEADRQKVRDRKAREKKKATAAVRKAIPPVPVARNFTLGQMLEDFLRRGTVENDNSENTIATYRSAIRCIEESCPDAWFSDVNAPDRRTVKGMYKAMRDARSNAMAAMAVNVLSIAYNWAIDDDDEKVTIANPALRIRKQKQPKRVRRASVAEIQHLIATADAMEEPLVASMILWGVWTAQRTGDRLALSYGDIRDGRLEIVQQKTGAEVSIPLATAIRARFDPQAAGATTLLHPLGIDDLRKRLQRYYGHWTKVLARAVQTMPSLAGLHDQDLRDTAATWMGRAGCTIPEVYAITGHKFSNETAIMGHYMALDYEVADNAIAKLEAWFDREVEKLKQQQERKAG